MKNIKNAFYTAMIGLTLTGCGLSSPMKTYQKNFENYPLNGKTYDVMLTQYSYSHELLIGHKESNRYIACEDINHDSRLEIVFPADTTGIGDLADITPRAIWNLEKALLDSLSKNLKKK